MAKMVTRKCKWCGIHFEAREADVKRGWAKCCCKSHASMLREKKKGPSGYYRRSMHDDAGLFCVNGVSDSFGLGGY